MFWFRIKTAGVLVCLLTVAGCAITPKALTQKEHADSVKQDLLSMFTQQEPVTGPITLQEAMARAIKYNLDHRLKLMEQAFSEGQLESARYELLPDLTLNAGYHNRNNISASSSESILDGIETLATSTSLERSWKTRDATFVWNILDFGVSYAQAKQQADQILISKEEKDMDLHLVSVEYLDNWDYPGEDHIIWERERGAKILSKIEPEMAINELIRTKLSIKPI